MGLVAAAGIAAYVLGRSSRQEENRRVSALADTVIQAIEQPPANAPLLAIQRGKVLVVPADVSVEIDGRRAEVWGGEVAVQGAPGSRHHVRLVNQGEGRGDHDRYRPLSRLAEARATARSVSLTDQGLRYYGSVAPHLAAIEDATIEAGGSSINVRGRLRVNVDGGTWQFVLTPRLEPFLAHHPGFSVEIAVRGRMGDLVREGFDVAVRFGFPEPSALKSRLLMRALSPAYPRRTSLRSRSSSARPARAG